jgi:glycosyltransferase involved in cell wall biosynthesis
MKVLIITQALDKQHPILGFFHRWVEEFAKHTEEVHVIALQTGDYDVPENVTVHSLGKERSANRLQRMFTFYLLLITLHKKYDSIFVHMNPEYIVLAGWWWRLTGKKIGLWYTHKSVDLKLRIAVFFADIIFTASKESFRVHSKKLQVMGHGIDTDFFTLDLNRARENHFLSVGRLMSVKRHDRAIRTAHEAGAPLRIVGDGPERPALEALAKELGALVTFLGALMHEELRDEYRVAARFIHTSETGSLDKVVLEALACGCPIQTADPALMFLQNESTDYVETHHSLKALIPRILRLYD